jgi:hypothetical protein
MAKALLGHVGGMDPRLIAEVRRLRQQVRELESQILRLQAENDALASAHAAHADDLLIDVSAKEPALA